MRHTIGFVNQAPMRSMGGTLRILRALMSRVPEDVDYVTAMISPNTNGLEPDPLYKEHYIPVRPKIDRIERSRFRGYCDALEPLFLRSFMARLETLFRQHNVTAIHAVPHGMPFVYANNMAERLGVPFYVNVHDELSYNLPGHPLLPETQRQLEKIWRTAAGRIVISDAMGKEYCRRWGSQEYIVVTDGLDEAPTKKRMPVTGRLNVYFMGSQHLSYIPNFQALLKALESLKSTTDLSVKLIARGGLHPDLANHPLVESRPPLPESQLEPDFDDADVLYLPLPMQKEHEAFYRFSLSTKMVTYLGIGVPILYNGPVDAAAATVLGDAAMHCHSLDTPDLVAALQESVKPERRDAILNAAFDLARDQFLLDDNARRFWNLVARNPAS